MRTLTVRLPEALVEELEAESQERGLLKSDIIRERLQSASRNRRPSARFAAISDLVGSVKGLPTDLSGRKKGYLQETGYGRKRNR